MNTIVHLLNMCPTTTIKGITPLEAWSGMKPSAKYLKVFYSPYYIHVPDAKSLKRKMR